MAQRRSGPEGAQRRQQMPDRSEAPVEVRAGAADNYTISAATEVLEGKGKRRGLGKLLPFMGPAFVAAVAYVDPGNFATNIAAGAQVGYMLVWVIIVSDL